MRWLGPEDPCEDPFTDENEVRVCTKCRTYIEEARAARLADSGRVKLYWAKSTLNGVRHRGHGYRAGSVCDGVEVTWCVEGRAAPPVPADELEHSPRDSRRCDHGGESLDGWLLTEGEVAALREYLGRQGVDLEVEEAQLPFALCEGPVVLDQDQHGTVEVVSGALPVRVFGQYWLDQCEDLRLRDADKWHVDGDPVDFTTGHEWARHGRPVLMWRGRAYLHGDSLDLGDGVTVPAAAFYEQMGEAASGPEAILWAIREAGLEGVQRLTDPVVVTVGQETVVCAAAAKDDLPGAECLGELRPGLLEALGRCRHDLEAIDLLEQWWGVDAQTRYGETPLHAALGGARENAAAVAFLLAQGAHPNLQGETGQTPLHSAAMGGHTEPARLLLNHGADVDAQAMACEYGRTPLHYAAWMGQTETAALLLDRGAYVNARDDVLSTPLHYSTDWGNTDMAALLLDRGADINARDEDGATPLHSAAVQGGLGEWRDLIATGIVELLLGRGADINARTAAAWTPLGCALLHDHTEIADLLRQRGGVE